ncbi:MAG: hypothetical protein ACLR8P_10900 [Clostridium fessum]
MLLLYHDLPESLQESTFQMPDLNQEQTFSGLPLQNNRHCILKCPANIAEAVVAANLIEISAFRHQLKN